MIAVLLAVVSSGLVAAMSFMALRAAEPSQLIPLLSWAFGGSVVLEGSLIQMYLIQRRGRIVVSKRPAKIDPEEVERLAAAKLQAQQDAALYTVITKDARELARKIPHHLANQMRMEQRQYSNDLITPGKKKKKIRWVQFEAALCTKTEIWYKVDGRPEKMPSGVSFYDLIGPTAQEKVIFNLEHGINRPCRWYTDPQYNVFLRVNLRNAIMGIPKRIEWQAVYHLLPKSNRFAVPLGVNEYSKLIYEDFRTWPHLLVAGATQQGKSTFLLQMITTLLKRNTARQLQFIFVDLKDGLELARFADVPHCRQFIEEPEGVPKALAWLHGEYKRRVGMYREMGVQNIKGYNTVADPEKKHAYIILVIDELADVMFEDNDIKNECVNWSVKLARKARAAGIHLWYCTQIVEAKVLPIQIRGNFPARVAFNMAGFDESRLVIGNGMSYGLETAGRCVYQFAADHKILQSPIAKVDDITAVIDGVKAAVAPDVDPFTEMDLFRIARDNYRGECGWRNLWADSDGGITADKTKDALKRWTYQPESKEPILELDGVRYLVINLGVAKGRRMLPAPAKLPASNEEARQLWDAGWESAPIVSLPEEEEEEDQDSGEIGTGQWDESEPDTLSGTDIDDEEDVWAS